MPAHHPPRAVPLILAVVTGVFSAVVAAQAPPPPPASATAGAAQRPAGLSPELAEASQKIHDGEYVAALAKIDAVLATDAKNPQARFLKGVVQTDRTETDAAITTFQGLIAASVSVRSVCTTPLRKRACGSPTITWP